MALKSPYRSIQPWRARQDGALGLIAETYIQKVLGYNPIAYWPLTETSGTTAVCQVNAAQNGTYARDVSVMGTGVGIGDGNTAPDFDGTNDFVNIYSVTFRNAFDGDIGTAQAWVFPDNWADGSVRNILTLAADADNFIDILKNGANAVRFRVKCNGVFNSYNYAVPVGERNLWLHCALTWSWGGVNTEVKCYIATDLKNTFNVAGQFTGNLAATTTCIGSANTTPANEYSGLESHCAVFATALGQSAITDLGAV